MIFMVTKSKADKELDNIEATMIKKKTPKEIEIEKIVKIIAPNVIKEAEWKTIELTDYHYRINWIGIFRMIRDAVKKFNSWWDINIRKIDPNEELYEVTPDGSKN